MTEIGVLALLKQACMQLSQEEYPETCAYIKEAVNEDCTELYVSVDTFIDNLMGCDASLPLEAGIAGLVEKHLSESIAEGNADRACDLGSLYYTGRIGEQNYKKAMELYHIAEAGGNLVAAENLGYCYYYGRDGHKDYEKAFRYFSIGAFLGHPVSLYKIGDMYKNGYYVEKNEALVYRLYRQAEEQLPNLSNAVDGADVYMRIGTCCEKGIGTEVDKEQAMFYLQRAEQFFRIRLKQGDFLIRNSYNYCVNAQQQLREDLEAELPEYGWTKQS